MSSVLFLGLIKSKTEILGGRQSTLSGPERAKVLRILGAVLVVDLEALRYVKGIMKNLQIKIIHAHGSGKVAGAPTGTQRIRPRNQQVVMQRRGLLVKASGMAALARMHWRQW